MGAVTAPKIMMGSRSIGMTLMATYVRRERARERLTPPTGTAALAFWDKKGTPSLPFGIRRDCPSPQPSCMETFCRARAPGGACKRWACLSFCYDKGGRVCQWTMWENAIWGPKICKIP